VKRGRAITDGAIVRPSLLIPRVWFASCQPLAYPADAMKIAGSIRIPMRAWVLLLAVLVALCATDLAGAGMAMADGQNCAAPFCEIQIGCGQPTQPQNTPASPSHLVAAPASGERLLPPARVETTPIDLSRPLVSSATLGPPASRAPPVI
jgi:hypothetical protein